MAAQVKASAAFVISGTTPWLSVIIDADRESCVF
jgi:hypothetical protein